MRNVSSAIGTVLRTSAAAWRARYQTAVDMTRAGMGTAAHAILPTPERVAAFVVDGAFLAIQRASIAARELPEIAVNLTDWHLSVEVGANRVGVTVGPHFLSYNRDNDIQIQIIAPGDYQAPTSELGVEWSSHVGLTHLFIPQVGMHGGVIFVGNQGDISIPPFNELPLSERPTLIPEGDE